MLYCASLAAVVADTYQGYKVAGRVVGIGYRAAAGTEAEAVRLAQSVVVDRDLMAALGFQVVVA
jgi:hypothetical protein